MPNKNYNLAIAWNWEHDQGFINCIRKEASLNNIRLLEICKANLLQIFDEIKNSNITIRYFLDRASDEDESFQPLSQFIRSMTVNPAKQINPHHLQIRAADKATMHLEFLAKGIEVPYTIIISPFTDSTDIHLSLDDLAKLGRPFIIKPANTTGGGIGVVIGAETLKEVIEARQAHKNDKYLLQETIKPTTLDGKRAWFRVFYAFGKILPCWWDDLTHIYNYLDEREEQKLRLGRLREITQSIYEVCRLDFFSTELVYTHDGRFIAVDYVNEMCDMRLKSQSYDGVPDCVVEMISSHLIKFVET